MVGGSRKLKMAFRRVPDEVLWRLRCDNRRQLVESVRWRTRQRGAAHGPGAPDARVAPEPLDPDALTLGSLGGLPPTSGRTSSCTTPIV
jgi:hypothetical protein